MTHRSHHGGRRRIAFAVSTAVLVTITGAGCRPDIGVDNPIGVTSGPVEAALAKTAAVRTMHVHQQFGKPDGELRFSVDIDLSAPESTFYMVMPSQDGKVTRSLVRQTEILVYIDSTTLWGRTGWHRVPHESNPADDPTAADSTPTELLRMEQASIVSSAPAGTETINGVATTRWSVQLDTEKYTRAYLDRNPNAAKGDAALRKSIADTKPVELVVFIDSAGWIVRQTGTSGGPMGALPYAFDYSGFDQPVDIPHPSPDEILESPR